MQFNIIIRSVRTLHDINQGLCFHYKNMRGLNKLNKKSKLPGLKRKEQESKNWKKQPIYRASQHTVSSYGWPRN